MRLHGETETSEPPEQVAQAPRRHDETAAVAAMLGARQPAAVTASSAMFLQRHAGNRAVAGLLAGQPDSYPHADTIQRSVGTDIPGRAVLSSDTARRSGVEAITEGDVTHFATAAPTLAVAAHEAAHLFQHAGRTHDHGLGPEGHAAAVEQRIGDGARAGDLLTGVGDRVPVGRRPYKSVAVDKQRDGVWNAGVDLRISANGLMAAEQSGEYGTHQFWAHASLIDAANAALAAAGSVIRLRQGAGAISGPAPDGTAASNTLTAVEPDNVKTHTSGDAMEIWADCGRAARDVIGVGRGTGKNYTKITGIYEESGSRSETRASDPKGMADEIIKETLGGGTSAADGWARYHSLSRKKRADFDRETGINRYARPEVGEGFTMQSGGTDFPGKSTWNFHWAGVVMRSGRDVVTLENYAVALSDAKNADWNFQMYGPSSNAGQTFHDQHLASHQHGDEPTTIQVGKR